MLFRNARSATMLLFVLRRDAVSSVDPCSCTAGASSKRLGSSGSGLAARFAPVDGAPPGSSAPRSDTWPWSCSDLGRLHCDRDRAVAEPPAGASGTVRLGPPHSAFWHRPPGRCGCCGTVPMVGLSPSDAVILGRCSELSTLPFGVSLLASSSLRGLNSSCAPPRAAEGPRGEERPSCRSERETRARFSAIGRVERDSRASAPALPLRWTTAPLPHRRRLPARANGRSQWAAIYPDGKKGGVKSLDNTRCLRPEVEEENGFLLVRSDHGHPTAGILCNLCNFLATLRETCLTSCRQPGRKSLLGP